MKKIFATLALSLFSLTAFAGTPLEQVEDTSLNAPNIEFFKRVSSPDQKVTAQVISNYIGSAYGISNYMITLFDQGPSEGDMVNSYTYSLGGYVSTPSKIGLRKVSSGVYELTIVGRALGEFKDDGSEPEYLTKTVVLTIKLDREGTVVSVEK